MGGARTTRRAASSNAAEDNAQWAQRFGSVSCRTQKLSSPQVVSDKRLTMERIQNNAHRLLDYVNHYAYEFAEVMAANPIVSLVTLVVLFVTLAMCSPVRPAAAAAAGSASPGAPAPRATAGGTGVSSATARGRKEAAREERRVAAAARSSGGTVA